MKKLFIIVCSLLIVGTGVAQVKKWKLAWSEEFNYTGLPDTSTWNFETYGNKTGWGNNEKQFYTDRDTLNAYVSNGTLKITARQKTRENKDYTSARLSTAKKKIFKYGRFEIKAKLPAGKGTWPAIWMLNNDKTVGWPGCGEIDIMEHVGYDKDTIHGTIHTEAYNHIKGTQKGKTIYIASPYDQFHVYAIEWTKDKIDFIMDGKVYNSFANEHKSANEWPFDKPFYLILNLAIGGNWGGKHGIDPEIFPATMEVDYVRVYRQK